MADRAVIQLCIVSRGETHDVDVPLDITAAELLEGLSEAYALGLDASDPNACYVKAEHPTVLMHGKKTLAQYGIRDGSSIFITD